MRKILLTILPIFLFSHCDTIIDVDYVTIYTFQNHSSYKIEMEVSILLLSNDLQIESAEIPIYDSGSFTIKGGTFREPFQYFIAGTKEEQVKVSNGEMQIIEDKSKDNTLYNLNNYTLKNSKKYTKEYQFIFTDKYFEADE